MNSILIRYGLDHWTGWQGRGQTLSAHHHVGSTWLGTQGRSYATVGPMVASVPMTRSTLPRWLGRARRLGAGCGECRSVWLSESRSATYRATPRLVPAFPFIHWRDHQRLFFTAMRALPRSLPVSMRTSGACSFNAADLPRPFGPGAHAANWIEHARQVQQQLVVVRAS